MLDRGDERSSIAETGFNTACCANGAVYAVLYNTTAYTSWTWTLWAFDQQLWRYVSLLVTNHLDHNSTMTSVMMQGTEKGTWPTSGCYVSAIKRIYPPIWSFLPAPGDIPAYYTILRSVFPTSIKAAKSSNVIRKFPTTMIQQLWNIFEQMLVPNNS